MNAPCSLMKEADVSRIVVSCGLPSPESSSPVSLACRVIMRRFAAAAVTSTEARPRQLPRTIGRNQDTLEKRDGESSSETHCERCSTSLGLEQVQDCGWVWHEDGSGFLLLRLQRKQLDTWKVKSSGYEAFGREYGLSSGRKMDCASLWNYRLPHLSTPTETDDYKDLEKGTRQQTSEVASCDCKSWDVVESGNSSSRISSGYYFPDRFNKLPSRKNIIRRNASMITRVMERDEMDVKAAAALKSCVSAHLQDGNGSLVDPLHQICLEKAVTTDVTGLAGTGAWFAERWVLNTSQIDAHGRLCQCCGGKRNELVGCTRQASHLGTTAGDTHDGVAAAVHVTIPQRSHQRAQANFLSSNESKMRLQKVGTEKGSKKIHRVNSTAFEASKRQSSCEGRLEGWRAQQLSVRAVVRTNKTEAAAWWNGQNSTVAGRERLRKTVTFSVDCFCSDREMTSGMLCHLCTPRRPSPLRQPLISRVPNSKYRLPGDVLSRSRSSSVQVVGVASTSQPGKRVLAASTSEKNESATAALARRDKGCNWGDPEGWEQRAEQVGSVANALSQCNGGKHRCVCSDLSVGGTDPRMGCTLAAATVYGDDGSPLREESFFIIVDCKNKPRASRWTRRGRTVVSRSYPRYVGPLLPLVLDLLEKERAAASIGFEDDSAQEKGKHGRTQPLSRQEKLSRSAELPRCPGRSFKEQQHSQKQPKQQEAKQTPHQEAKQHLPHRQLPRLQREQQQRQSFETPAQKHQQKQLQREVAKQRHAEPQQPLRPRVKDQQQQSEGVGGAAPSEFFQRPLVQRQSGTQLRSKDKTYSDSVSRNSGNPRTYQAGTPPPPTPHIYSRYHHPLDTPETLFPQARARQLRRLLMQQNTTADDPLVLPLLTGDTQYGAASSSMEGKLAAYHTLARRSVTARAVATAARHPAVLSRSSSLLQRQQSQFDNQFSFLYAVPQARGSADVYDRLRYATSEPEYSPGFWTQSSPPVAALRQVTSCSFALEHNGRERGGLGSSNLRFFGTEENRSFRKEIDIELETEEEKVDEDSDREEDEEKNRFRRRPIFHRMSRSSGATVAQRGAENGRKFSQLSSVSSYLHRRGSIRITTGEKLKRLLNPLFSRSSSSTGDSSGPTNKRDEELDLHGCKEVLASETNPKKQMQRLEVSPCDENLWVTESDGSTPPSSCIVVKSKTNKQLQSWSRRSASLDERRSVRAGKRTRRTRPNSENRERAAYMFFPAASATVPQRRRDGRREYLEPGQPERNHNSGETLSERDPQASELPTVMEEPAEEVQACEKLSMLAIRTWSEKFQAEEKVVVKEGIQVPTATGTGKQHNCVERSVQQQQIESRSPYFLQNQEQRSSQLWSSHFEDQEKQVDERREVTHKQKRHEQQADVQQQYDGVDPGSQSASQQQPTTSNEGGKWPRPWNLIRGRETQLSHRDLQHTRHQEGQLQQKMQQEQQQSPQARRSSTETRKNGDYELVLQERPLPIPLQRGEQMAQRGESRCGGTDIQNMEQQGIRGDAPLRVSTRGIQNQRRFRERGMESLHFCGEGAENEEADNHATQHTGNPLNLTHRLVEAGAHDHHELYAARNTLCRRENILQPLCKDPNAEYREFDKNSEDGEILASVDKEPRQTCTQQTLIEHKQFSNAVRSPLLFSKSHNGNEHISSSSAKAASHDTSHGTPYTRNGLDDLLVCNLNAYERSSQSVDTATPAEERAQSNKLEEAFFKGGNTSTCRPPEVTPLTALLKSADESLTLRKKDASRSTRSRSLVARQALLRKILCFAEVGSPTEKCKKGGTGRNYRWRWRGSCELGPQKTSSRELNSLLLPSAQTCTQSAAELTRQTAAANATAWRAAANGGPASPSCSDEQIANSTSADSQQTVNFHVNSSRISLRKNSLATVFLHTPVAWSKRSSRRRKDEPQNVPSLLQRLSGKVKSRPYAVRTDQQVKESF